MKHAEKIVLVHNGALGDFLMAWPALWSICNKLPTKPVFWAGKTAYLPFLKPLNVRPASSSLLRDIRSLHICSEQRHAWADNIRLLWFYLGKKPFQIKHENIFFLQGIRDGCWDSPRKLYAKELAACNIPFDTRWRPAFQAIFPPQSDLAKKQVLIFPGSGNPAKNWPLVQFFALGIWLKQLGLSPLLMLGPVEQEMGITPPEGLAVRRPQSMDALITILQQASFVIGNDSGPMHLAGYMGIPGLSFFGPTSPRQWGPPGMDILCKNLPCSPCTQTARITCTTRECIQDITLEEVKQRCNDLFTRYDILAQNKTGSRVTHNS